MFSTRTSRSSRLFAKDRENLDCRRQHSRTFANFLVMKTFSGLEEPLPGLEVPLLGLEEPLPGPEEPVLRPEDPSPGREDPLSRRADPSSDLKSLYAGVKTLSRTGISRSPGCLRGRSPLLRGGGCNRSTVTHTRFVLLLPCRRRFVRFVLPSRWPVSGGRCRLSDRPRFSPPVSPRAPPLAAPPCRHSPFARVCAVLPQATHSRSLVDTRIHRRPRRTLRVESCSTNTSGCASRSHLSPSPSVPSQARDGAG